MKRPARSPRPQNDRILPCQVNGCTVWARLMMVRFLSQDGNVMSEEFMGKTDRWDGFQGLEIISIIPREPGEPDREARV